MAEQITITVPDGTRDKLRTVGTIMGSMSAEDVTKELALIASCIPQNGGVRIFRDKFNALLSRMGVSPEPPQVVYMGHRHD